MSSMIPAGQSPFDSIRHVDASGNEYWSGKELATLLTYKWQNLESVIDKAKIACLNSGYIIDHHFTDTSKVIPGGRHGHQTITDINLTRYACYLVAQNADPSKEIVALAQTYFAAKTRQQEQSDQRNQSIEDVIAAAKARVEARGKLSESYDELEATATDQGMRGSRNYATLHNNGDVGMFTMSKDALADRHQVQPQRGHKRVNMNDHFGTSLMGGIIMRNTIAGADIGDMQDPTNQEMWNANRSAGEEIREVFMRHGIVPEDVPPEPHISEARRIADGQIPMDLLTEGDEAQ